MMNKRMAHEASAKTMLLPLPLALVRSISLENHMSLAAMRSGYGSAETLCVLLRVLYMLFFMLDGSYGDGDIPRLLETESALEKSVHAVASGKDWHLDEASLLAMEEVMSRFDEVVANVSVSLYQESWEKTAEFARSALQSPIPASQVGEVWLLAE
ncbi:hypothetical protein GQ57_24440 [Burkholderia sp. MSh2]|nr:MULTISPECIES: hypothetical protein [Burkholderia]KEZ03298.1 hypothetical protein GQ57_24440 [Burkholderia sp. MSh2]